MKKLLSSISKLPIFIFIFTHPLIFALTSPMPRRVPFIGEGGILKHREGSLKRIFISQPESISARYSCPWWNILIVMHSFSFVNRNFLENPTNASVTLNRSEFEIAEPSITSLLLSLSAIIHSTGPSLGNLSAIVLSAIVLSAIVTLVFNLAFWKPLGSLLWRSPFMPHFP